MRHPELVDAVTTTTFDREAATRALPMGRIIFETGYVLAGFGIHRDSDALDESNYAVAMRALLEAVGQDPMDLTTFDSFRRTPYEAEDLVPMMVGSWGHWAVGWTEELLIRADNAALVAEADRLLARLEDYAVLDEEHYSAHEWETNHPDADDNCYSDDPDCGCGRDKA